MDVFCGELCGICPHEIASSYSLMSDSHYYPGIFFIFVVVFVKLAQTLHWTVDSAVFIVFQTVFEVYFICICILWYLLLICVITRVIIITTTIKHVVLHFVWNVLYKYSLTWLNKCNRANQDGWWQKTAACLMLLWWMEQFHPAANMTHTTPPNPTPTSSSTHQVKAHQGPLSSTRRSCDHGDGCNMACHLTAPIRTYIERNDASAAHNGTHVVL